MTTSIQYHKLDPTHCTNCRTRLAADTYIHSNKRRPRGKKYTVFFECSCGNKLVTIRAQNKHELRKAILEADKWLWIRICNMVKHWNRTYEEKMTAGRGSDEEEKECIEWFLARIE